jgi:predicted negative regulator of RcsB-dependent stress response
MERILMAVELYDEHEQSERVRNWIKEYGFSIVMGLVLAFGGIFGFRYWQDHQAGQRYLAAEYFDVIQRELEADSLGFAEEQYQQMRESVSRNAYVGLAGLKMAAAYVDDGQLSPAARIYREILEQRRFENIWPVATIRLARVLEAQGDLSDAESLVAGTAPVGFESKWAEMRGDILMARGELEQARMAYQEALENLIGQGAGRGMLEIKIDATGPGPSEETS